jgi:ankyrin repeat protein
MGCCNSRPLDFDCLEFAKTNQYEMIFAIKSKDWTKVKGLIEKGFPVSYKMPREGSSTALHLAAQSEASEIVSELLKLNADLESEDAQGLTPIFYAVKAKSVGITKTLCSKGAKVNHQAKDNSKLEDYFPSDSETRSSFLQELTNRGYVLKLAKAPQQSTVVPLTS